MSIASKPTENIHAEGCTISGLHKSYGDVEVLKGIDLDVEPGQVVCLIGPSGSGKSTLLRCLARLIEPTAGQVRLDGQDLLKVTPRELIELRRHKLGMVFQHFALLPYLTVLGNVAFPLAVQGVDRAAREARAREMIGAIEAAPVEP